MTSNTDSPAPVAPSFPAASIDFNAVLENEAAGKTGSALLDGAILNQPAAEEAGEAEPQGDGYTATYQPIGKYVLNGPGMTEPEIFTGKKDAALARLDEIRASHTVSLSGGNTDPA